MKDRMNKIFGLLLFMLLITVIISLGITSADNEERASYSAIELKETGLLSSGDYLKYAGFKDESSLSEFALGEIKNKFEKHPYVVKADVEFDGVDKVVVELKERNFVAVIFENQKFSLLTEQCELVPVFSNTQFYQLPIITNPGKISFDDAEKSKTLMPALRIIAALKFCSEEVYDKLAEINLNRGGDVILTFEGLKLPVIFGKGSEARKVLTLREIWEDIYSSGSIYSNMEYVDLRFNKQILIGKKGKSDLKG